MTDSKYATPFSLLHSASLLSQKSRVEKFATAIARIVQSESYVVDIGSGSGILSLLAAKAGARKVTSIEINPAALEYAKQAAIDNELENRIEFLGIHFCDFEPEERADVVICEMLSSMMLIEQQIPAAKFAIDNILKSNGVMLPQKINIYCALVECEEVWNRFNIKGIQFPRLPQTVSNEDSRDLSDLALVESFDFSQKIDSIEIDTQLNFEIVSDGIVHGISGMFEAVLFDEIVLGMDDGWRELFVPFQEPIVTMKGNEISIRIRYTPGIFDSISIDIFE